MIVKQTKIKDANPFILLVLHVRALLVSLFHAFLLRDGANGCAARFTVLHLPPKTLERSLVKIKTKVSYPHRKMTEKSICCSHIFINSNGRSTRKHLLLKHFQQFFAQACMCIVPVINRFLDV